MSVNELQRHICLRAVIYIIKICTSNNALFKTNPPVNIPPLAAGAQLAQGHLRRLSQR
jgi:hypothetical protein